MPQDAANRKRQQSLATAQAAKEKSFAKKFRIDAAEAALVRNIAAVAAREHADPHSDAIHATLRKHSDVTALLPRSRDVAYKTLPTTSALCVTRTSVRPSATAFSATPSPLTASGLRTASAIAASVERSSLSVPSPSSSHSSKPRPTFMTTGKTRPCGTSSSSLMPSPAATELSKLCTIRGRHQGRGRGQFSCGTHVEGKLRDAIGELGRGRDHFLFSCTLLEIVPVEDIAIFI